MPIRSERVQFNGALGNSLAGRLDLPEETPHAMCVFAHCFTCSKDYLAPKRISQGLAARGIATLRFDFTGLGESAGEFARTKFSTNVADIRCALAYLQRRFDLPLVLLGHSLGGAACLAAAVDVPEVRVVATLAAPSEPVQITEHFSHVLPEIERRGETSVEIGGRPIPLTRQFIEDVRTTRLQEALATLECAILVFHSPLDQIVTIDHGARIFELAPHAKSFFVLHEADHLLTDRRDAEYVAAMIAGWLDRYE